MPLSAPSAIDLDAMEQALTGLVQRGAQETTRYYNMRSKDKGSATGFSVRATGVHSRWTQQEL